MKAMLALAFTVVFAASPVLAQDKKAPSEAQKKQQDRMRECNKQASGKGINGEARQEFMRSCLKADAAKKADDGKMTAQQNKMKECNKQASSKGINGEARQQFMRSCLKG